MTTHDEFVFCLDSIYHSLCSGEEVTKEQMDALGTIIDRLKKMKQGNCATCLHYNKGVHYEDGVRIKDNVGFCGLIERVFMENDYCSYHTGR